jgi:hypothetical protein
MQAAGFEIGSRVKLDVKPGCILLTVQEVPATDAPKVRKMGRLQLARLQAQEAAQFGPRGLPCIPDRLGTFYCRVLPRRSKYVVQLRIQCHL